MGLERDSPWPSTAKMHMVCTLQYAWRLLATAHSGVQDLSEFGTSLTPTQQVDPVVWWYYCTTETVCVQATYDKVVVGLLPPSIICWGGARMERTFYIVFLKKIKCTGLEAKRNLILAGRKQPRCRTHAYEREQKSLDMV